jgi:hypothetical protein
MGICVAQGCSTRVLAMCDGRACACATAGVAGHMQALTHPIVQVPRALRRLYKLACFACMDLCAAPLHHYGAGRCVKAMHATRAVAGHVQPSAQALLRWQVLCAGCTRVADPEGSYSTLGRMQTLRLWCSHTP